MYSVEPLSPNLGFGAVIRGIGSEDIVLPEQRAELRRLWEEHGLLVFKGTHDLTTQFHIELSRCFGDLQRHFAEDMLVEGQPELISFRSDPERDGIFEVDGELRSGYIPWHSDFRWMAHPNRGGILRILRQPPEGGETGFLDGMTAYESMPDELKARIEGREVVYQMVTDDRMFRFHRGHRIRTIELGSSKTRVREQPPGKFPPVAYPFVMTLPESNRKYLSYSPFMAQYVLGMDDKASEELLFDLSDYYTDSARAYFHEWELGDLVLWDNWRMLHQAEGAKLGEDREGVRTTIAGEYPTGRQLEEGGWKFDDPLHTNLEASAAE